MTRDFLSQLFLRQVGFCRVKPCSQIKAWSLYKQTKVVEDYAILLFFAYVKIMPSGEKVLWFCSAESDIFSFSMVCLRFFAHINPIRAFACIGKILCFKQKIL